MNSTNHENLASAYFNVLEKIKIEDEMSLSDMSQTVTISDRNQRIHNIIQNSPFSAEHKDILSREFLQNGPIEALIKDQNVTEIIINSKGEIFYELDGVLKNHSRAFLSPLSYAAFIDRLTASMNVTINYEFPFCNGVWENFRIHLIGPPLTDGYNISLRRQFGTVRNFEDLLKKNWAPEYAIEKIKQLVIDKKSFIIIGGTGSGKTSVLNICLRHINSNERVVSIEDTKEIQLPNPSCVNLLTRNHCFSDNRDINQSELLKQCLRMRPDRIVVGEIRGSEAKDYIMALSTGHAGSISTLHAETAHQALTRLELLIQMGAPQWRPESIRQLIHLGLQYIIIVKNYAGQRQLKGIYQLASLEDSGFCIDDIYTNPRENN